MRTLLACLAQSTARFLMHPAAIVLAGVAIFLGLASLGQAQPRALTAAMRAVGEPKGKGPRLDLTGGVDWLNVDRPITAGDLKGRVVLVDFWTLCCINCIHTLPDLAKLEARYPGV